MGSIPTPGTHRSRRSRFAPVLDSSRRPSRLLRLECPLPRPQVVIRHPWSALECVSDPILQGKDAGMSPSLAAGQRYVLVVANDQVLLERFCEALRGAGFDPVSVTDGLSALRCVDAAKPRAVVLDVDLPQRGGLDVQHELKAHPDTRYIPIVLLGGKNTARMGRGDVVLRKPVSADDLIASVQRCLRAVN